MTDLNKLKEWALYWSRSAVAPMLIEEFSDVSGTPPEDAEVMFGAADALGELIGQLEAAQECVDEVRQRLANAEHQLYMKDLAIGNIKASRREQWRKRKEAEAELARRDAEILSLRDWVKCVEAERDKAIGWHSSLLKKYADITTRRDAAVGEGPCVHKWIKSEGRTASGWLCAKCGDYDGPSAKWAGEPVAWRYRATNLFGDLLEGWKFSETESLMGLYQPLYTSPQSAALPPEVAEQTKALGCQQPKEFVVNMPGRFDPKIATFTDKQRIVMRSNSTGNWVSYALVVKAIKAAGGSIADE